MDTTLITFKCLDKSIQVPINVASVSKTIYNLLNCDSVYNENESIELLTLNSDLVSHIMLFCKCYVSDPHIIENNDWTREFLNIDNKFLFEMTNAANYLDIPPLLDFCCLSIANNLIKGKTPEQIRETFGLTNDFMAEEEEQIRIENSWYFNVDETIKHVVNEDKN